MTRTEFIILADEVLNEFGCVLLCMNFNKDEICEITYHDSFSDGHFYSAYRFMNRVKLRLIIMDQLNLLIPIDPELDLGF